MGDALPYVGMGPCGICGHPDAGHRVRDAIASRVRAGDAVEEVAADFDLTAAQVVALIAIAEQDTWTFFIAASDWERRD